MFMSSKINKSGIKIVVGGETITLYFDPKFRFTRAKTKNI